MDSVTKQQIQDLYDLHFSKIMKMKKKQQEGIPRCDSVILKPVIEKNNMFDLESWGFTPNSKE